LGLDKAWVDRPFDPGALVEPPAAHGPNYGVLRARRFSFVPPSAMSIIFAESPSSRAGIVSGAVFLDAPQRQRRPSCMTLRARIRSSSLAGRHHVHYSDVRDVKGSVDHPRCRYRCPSWGSRRDDASIGFDQIVGAGFRSFSTSGPHGPRHDLIANLRRLDAAGSIIRARACSVKYPLNANQSQTELTAEPESDPPG